MPGLRGAATGTLILPGSGAFEVEAIAAVTALTCTGLVVAGAETVTGTATGVRTTAAIGALITGRTADATDRDGRAVALETIAGRITDAGIAAALTLAAGAAVTGWNSIAPAGANTKVVIAVVAIRIENLFIAPSIV